MTAMRYTVSRAKAHDLPLDQLHNVLRRMQDEADTIERDIKRRQNGLADLKVEMSAYRDENVDREETLKKQELSRREAQFKLARAARSSVGHTGDQRNDGYAPV